MPRTVEVPEYELHTRVHGDPARTALLVIDMQNDFVKEGGTPCPTRAAANRGSSAQESPAPGRFSRFSLARFGLEERPASVSASRARRGPTSHPGRFIGMIRARTRRGRR